MRLLIASDLHHNHHRSQPLANELIDKVNSTGGDVLILVGDSAVTADWALEKCLERFTFKGTKLFVAGNHELWTRGSDSYELFTHILPQSVGALGWQWLQTKPFVSHEVAIVGSVGWYDYSFAEPRLEIPHRFYEAKVSPGAAERFEEYDHLFKQTDDISKKARNVVARWNDGKFVSLHRSDDQFLEELLTMLRQQLETLKDHPHVLAAIHQLPFRELLPPPHTAQWDFAKAYLGSEKIGKLLLEYPNVKQVFCGHSHFPAEAQVGHILAKNTGCSYKRKRLNIVDVPS